MEKISAFIQARMSSERFPGKVLKQILEKPLLELLIERVKRAKLIGDIFVLTSTDVTDNPIVELCDKIGIRTFRGNLLDVLDRYYKAALTFKVKHIVRITADCPLIDPGVIDDIISFYSNGNYDYASNTIEPTFPDGLDTEVFTFSALKKTWENAKFKTEREHVTLYIYEHPKIFRLGSYVGNKNYNKLRWTVDYKDDFELVKIIYENLYTQNKNFCWLDVINFLNDNPSLLKLNCHHPRNEKLINPF